MARDDSIKNATEDNYSSSIITMLNASPALDKYFTAFMSKIDTLNKKKISIKVDDRTKTELAKMETQLAAINSAVDRLGQKTAKLSISTTGSSSNTENLSTTGSSSKTISLSTTGSSKNTKSLSTTGSSSNTIILSTTGSSSNNESEESKSSQLKSSVFNELKSTMASTLADSAGVMFKSAFGDEAGNVFSNALSMGVKGLLERGPIAGLVGAIAGVIKGATENFKKMDDAFKQYYNNQYDRITEAQNKSIARGIDIYTEKGPESENKSNYLKAKSNMEEAQDKVDSAYAEGFTYVKDNKEVKVKGYAEERTAGMTEQANFLNDPETGSEMKDINARVGNYEANKENLKEKYNRDAYKTLITGDASGDNLYANDPKSKERLEELNARYKDLKNSKSPEAGAELERIKAEVEAISENAYNSSTLVQNDVSLDKSYKEHMRIDAASKGTNWNGDYQRSQVSTQGLLGSTDPVFVTAEGAASGIIAWPYGYPSTSGNTSAQMQTSGTGNNNQGTAGGNGTAQTANAQAIKPVYFNISGNTINLKSEDDIEKTAQQIIMKIISANDLSTV